ncbi:hypothetical protein WKI68_32155 [Streptomyces sp. MS1.HAVA.3]|uniref:Uncharacterized protein n=1 Tax=Streptomyces caledonius TaxID=3134107 RepID=A0ABU8U9W4_9ACTN
MGDAGLVRLYEAAGRDPLPAALGQALGTDVPTLTRAWQESLRADLG